MHNKVLNRLAIATITILGLETTLAQARPVIPPLFQNARIRTNFAPDPLTLRGISGGSVPGKKVAGRAETANGLCVGFVDAQPDHILVLRDFFDFLRLEVRSPQDTTMILRGPGGTWCNDDAKGKNPGISGQWLAGKYRIWVGSFNKSSYYPYILRITKKR